MSDPMRSPEERGKLMAVVRLLTREGLNTTEISKRTRVPRSTVQRWQIQQDMKAAELQTPTYVRVDMPAPARGRADLVITFSAAVIVGVALAVAAVRYWGGF